MDIYVSLPISGQDMERVKKDCKKASREGWKRWAYVKDLLPIKEDEK